MLSTSTASLVGSTLQVNAAPAQQIRFQVDQHDAKKVEVLDDGKLLGQFPIASVDFVSVTVAGDDAVNVDYSNGLPFTPGIQVFLSGSGSLNSLTLEGTVKGGETYISRRQTVFGEAGSLTVGGNGTVEDDDANYLFTSTIGWVTDLVKTTAPLVVESFGSNVILSGSNGVTQTLSGLSDGGAGDTLTYSNKNLVNLEMLSDNAIATLNATAAAAGEQSFEVSLQGSNELVSINATPKTVTTKVTANSILGPAADATVNLFANSGPVSINGDPATTNVTLGKGTGSTLVTSGIKANVSVKGVKSLAIADFDNTKTRENVTVTESTIKGTGLFGNSSVLVNYSNVKNLAIFTGELVRGLPESYTIEGSHFTTAINLVDDAEVGLTVQVNLTASSNLNLNVQNGEGQSVGPATVDVNAPGATFNLTQDSAGGSDTVTFGKPNTTSTIDFEADLGKVTVHNSNK